MQTSYVGPGDILKENLSEGWPRIKIDVPNYIGLMLNIFLFGNAHKTWVLF